jgi:hypothetical protein
MDSLARQKIFEVASGKYTLDAPPFRVPLSHEKCFFIMATLNFAQVIVMKINPGASPTLSVPTGKVWKIESVSISGTSGSVILKKGGQDVGILFSTISNSNYGSQLPFWLNDTFGASVLNDSTHRASVSITEWNIAP